MSQKKDLRTVRTRKAIRDAFIALLTEHGFNNVTVQMLCQTANINRATFYRHYHDKYDLAQQLTELLFADVYEQFGQMQEADPVTVLQHSFEHIERYADFYRAMMTKGGIPGFQTLIQQSVEMSMTEYIKPLLAEQSPPMPMALIIRYMATAQAGFMSWWLENDMPYTPAEAAAYLSQLHLQGGLTTLGVLGTQKGS